MTRVRSVIDVNSLREMCVDNVEKSGYSYSELSPANLFTKKALDIYVKQPSMILLLKGTLYEFKYSNE